MKKSSTNPASKLVARTARTHPALPPVMILCGGKGTRLGDVTRITPKPMVKIGNDPILWHIMQWYAQFGCKRFILCLGHLQSVIRNYFTKHAKAIARMGWQVELVDTGAETGTGGRIWRAAKKLRSTDDHFFLTYGDGVANVDIRKLLRKHLTANRAITISGVHPASRFGEIVFKGDRITDFQEKTRSKFYINGGFMVVARRFLREYLTADAKMFFEQRPMRTAAACGDMTLYRHEGFWQCMDNPREHALLNELWAAGQAPWKNGSNSRRFRRS